VRCAHFGLSIVANKVAAQTELPPALESALDEYAADLRSGQPRVPVLLRSICDQLGIKVYRDGQVPDGKAYLAWDRRTQAAPTILLPTKRNDRWDRFCAAHELGHYFLVTRHDWIPVGHKAYWQTEDLCDHFARKLLLPDEEIPVWFSGLKGAAAYLTKCDEIAELTITPWKEAATTISSIFPVIFFGVESSDRLGGMRVSSSSLPQRRGNKAEISAESEVAKILGEASRRAYSTRSPADVRLDAAAFRETKLDQIFRKLRVTELTARIWPLAKRIKVAAMVPAS
jgi:hypothetical protein